MHKLFSPVNAQLTSQSGGIKWGLLSILVVAAFALTWFYPDIKNNLSPPPSGEDVAGKKPPGGRPGKGGGEGSRSTPVSVGEVRLMDIRYTVQAAGTLVALYTAVVRANVDGELKSLCFTL